MPFGAITGHASLVDLLRQAVARGRVPQSLLFAGPEGVGKHAVALALAQAVNCPNRRDGDACGTCSTCTRIARGQHSDVTILDKGDSASIKIEPVRERILEVIGYRPFEALRRVYIIDPADELTEQAQDALLKTLEEPPASAILILVTAYPDTLRPTIQSRCRRLRFGTLTDEDVARVLIQRGTPAAEARKLAATSGGSVGRAMAEDAGDLDADREAALGLVVACAGGRSVADRLKAATSLANHAKARRAREAMGTRLAIVASLLRDVGVLTTGVRDPNQLANTDLVDVLGKVAGRFDLARLSSGYAAIDHAQMALVEHNASPKIVADWIALTL